MILQKHFLCPPLWLQFSVSFLTHHSMNNLLAENFKALLGLFLLRLFNLNCCSVQIPQLSKYKEENMSVGLAVQARNQLSVKILRVTMLPCFKYIPQVGCLWITPRCWDSQGTWTSVCSSAHSILTAPVCFPNTCLTFTCCLIFTFKLRNCLCRNNLCLCICTACSVMVPWPLGTITI